MLVDAHCHLTGRSMKDGEACAWLERAQAAGVTGAVIVNGDFEEVPGVLDLARRTPVLQASVGLHPHEATLWSPEVEATLREALGDPCVRFVGETGLDWHYDFSPRSEQEVAFRAQIGLALEVRKPLMIHTRSAPQATLDILREEGAREAGGIIHCFSEDLAFAREALDLGFHLSFSGIVTFPKSAEIQAVAAWAPLDRILVETDSPYLAPVPHRGKRNEPAHVVHVAAMVARLRGITPEEVAAATSRNLEALCGWLPPSC